MGQHIDIDHYLASLPEPSRGIGTELRPILDAALPASNAVIWHGQPVWMRDKKPLAGFKAYTAYVTLMIWNGRDIADPTGRLTPGRHMSTVKIRAIPDIDRDAINSWLRSAHPA
jgi:hypothetical protein